MNYTTNNLIVIGVVICVFLLVVIYICNRCRNVSESYTVPSNVVAVCNHARKECIDKSYDFSKVNATGIEQYYTMWNQPANNKLKLPAKDPRSCIQSKGYWLRIGDCCNYLCFSQIIPSNLLSVDESNCENIRCIGKAKEDLLIKRVSDDRLFSGFHGAQSDWLIN